MPFNTDKHLQELANLRHKLHTTAEVSGSEKETSAIIEDFLKRTSPDELQTEVGGHGVFATYESGNEGPHLLIRCELDALPIPDVNKIEYKSKSEGVGHKCGHDGHMAIVCGVAKALGEKSLQAGKVTVLFQPAEETGEGARRVLDDPKFQELSPDYCFALHNLPGFKKHQIVAKEGVFAAASTGLIVNFKGSTAHAAHPEQGKSPALALAQTMQSFSAMPQFYSPLKDAAKVTLIHANLGERAFGTSPAKGTVMATLRTYDQQLLKKLRERAVQIAKQTAQTYELNIDFEWVEPFPSTVNHSKAVDVVTSVASRLELEVHHKENPFSWSEDFGHFTNDIPGAMFGLGIGKEHPALHAENYDFPDDVIATGITMFTEIINEVIDTE